MSAGRREPIEPGEARGPELGAGTVVRIASVGLLGMMAGSLLQYSLSVASPELVDALGMTEPQVGLAMSVLMGTATILVRCVGPVADRIGARRSLVVLFLSAICSLVVLAAARSLLWVLAAAVIGGLAIACGNPVTNMVVAGRDATSGLIVGIKQSGVMVAQVLCGLSIPLVALFGSWRLGVAALVVMPLAGMALVAGLPGDRPRRRASTGGDRGVPPVGWLTGYSFLAAWAISTLTTYLPTFAVGQVGMSLTMAGAVVVGMGLAGFVARLTWATVAGSMARPRLLLAALSGVGAVAIGAVGASQAGGPLLVWSGALAAGSCMAGFSSVVQVVVLRVAPEGGVGRATGVVQLGFLGGLFAGPATAGLLLALGGYPLMWCAAALAAIAAAAVTAAGPAAVPLVSRSGR